MTAKRMAVVGVLGLLLLTGCTTMDAVTGKETRNFYSLQDDVQFGSQAYAETLAEVRTQGIPVNADAARTAQLREMVRRIGAVSNLPDLPYEVALIHTNVVNAMAAPGGKIMVYEGLWDPQNGLVQDDDELAAVLAHEIAHVNCRHSTEAMTRALPGNMLAAASVIATQKTKYEQLGQTMAAAGMFIHNGLWMTHYSRNDEIEADRVGMMYMAKAGYDPRAAARIWERAAARRNGADSIVGIFSTHPADNVRLQNLRDHLPAAMDIYQQTLAGR